jgi:hypothetical protein
MQTNLQEFFNAKKLPPWLVEHAAFKSINKVEKIFPRIGLPNCVEPCVFENVESARASGEALVSYLREYIQGARYSLEDHIPERERTNPIYVKPYSCVRQLEKMMENPASFINKNGGKVSINLPEQVIDADGKPIYRKGAGFFKVYNNLAEELAALKKGARLRKLEKISLFKAFSSVNIPTDKFSIVFSSDGVDGLWDIATMSMRGITSCQRWQGQYRHCLIGSIVDPFTAIIYLTSGTDYKHLGAKMIRRSVVRFVVDALDKKPYILIDRVYPSYDEEAVKKFIEFITQKTHGKFKVMYGPNMGLELQQHSYIPKSGAAEVLNGFRGTNLFSYQDTKVPIGKTVNKNERNRSTNLRTRQLNLQRISAAASTIKFSKEYVNSKKGETPEFKEFLTKVITGPDFRHHIVDFSRRLVGKITLNCPSLPMEDPDEYTRRLCFYYFINKKKLIKTERTAFIRRMNNYYVKRVHGRPMWDSATQQYVRQEVPFKLKTENFNAAFDYLESQISAAVKGYAIETMKKSEQQN